MNPAARALEMLSFHRFLLGHTNVRLETFRQAVMACVKPGDLVLDLGTGTGILAFFACLAGARRVFAVETGPVIELARLLARENGFENRVVFLDRASFNVELPEQVDVLLTDTFSLWQLDAWRSVIDARDRLVKPDGVLIPSSIEFLVAPADVPETYLRYVDFWNRSREGIDLSGIRPLAVNQCYPARVKARALLTEGASLGRVSFSDARSVVFQGSVSVTARRAGMFHGVCLWLASHLANGIVLENRPGATMTNYAQGFLPLAQPTAVQKGDRIQLSMTSIDSTEWRWQGEVQRPAGEASETIARFDQSTFLGMPLSAASLRHLATECAPTLSRLGRAEHYLLGLFDGETLIAELRERLLQRYPDLFTSPEDVSVFVAEVVARSG